MKASIRVALAALFASVLITPLVTAQPHRDPPTPTRVILYSQANFKGERIVVEVDDQIDDFNYTRFPSGRIANNRVSSIKIEGDGVDVTLFNYRSFKGEQITIRDSIPYLSDIPLNESESWENNLSSITVRKIERRGPPRRDDDFVGPRPPPSTNRPEPKPVIDREFRRNETAKMVRRVYLDVLGREADSAGLANFVGIVEDRGWSEDRLRNEFLRSDEYRNVTVPRLVSEAYQNVLRRTPDPAGLAYYSKQITKSGWTVARVEDALRRSPEYRSKSRT